MFRAILLHELLSTERKIIADEDTLYLCYINKLVYGFVEATFY